jgi:hypothetical protein
VAQKAAGLTAARSAVTPAQCKASVKIAASVFQSGILLPRIYFFVSAHNILSFRSLRQFNKRTETMKFDLAASNSRIKSGRNLFWKRRDNSFTLILLKTAG